jgi:hypothetical protein
MRTKEYMEILIGNTGERRSKSAPIWLNKNVPPVMYIAETAPTINIESGPELCPWAVVF